MFNPLANKLSYTDDGKTTKVAHPLKNLRAKNSAKDTLQPSRLTIIRRVVFDIIDENDGSRNKLNHYIGLLIVALILLSVVAVILESDRALFERYESQFYWFEFIAVIFFSIEYILRLWTAPLLYPKVKPWKARLKYIFSIMAIIDFLAIVPFYVSMMAVFGFIHIDMRFVRVFRLMRLLRIFKLNRYNDSMKLIGNVLKDEREKLLVTIFMTTILLVLASSLIYTVEHEIQPEAFPNIISSMWWAVATLTTVGYGDVYPVTAFGKMLAGIIALLGIGLVALPTGILSSSFVQRLNQKSKRAKNHKLRKKWGRGGSRPIIYVKKSRYKR